MIINPEKARVILQTDLFNMIKKTPVVISHKTIFHFLFLMLTVGVISKSSAQILTTGVLPQDRICGKWISEEKNCIVQVYKNGNEFGAKLIWFDDSDDKNQTMSTRTDTKNPNKALQGRKLLGMDVVDNLTYNPAINSWENGLIYDAKSGRTWSSAAYITHEGSMKVTGYWHFKFIGKSMNFKRYGN